MNIFRFSRMLHLLLFLLKGCDLICSKHDTDSIKIENLECGKTIKIDNSIDTVEFNFDLIKQKISWVNQECIIKFKLTKQKSDGMLLTFVSHSIHSFLPGCQIFALILRLHSGQIKPKINEDQSSHTTEKNSQLPIQEDLSFNQTYSAIRLCSSNWESKMDSYMLTDSFSLEIKHPLVANSHLELNPAVKGEELDLLTFPKINSYSIEDEDKRQNNFSIDSSSVPATTDHEINNLLKQDKAVANKSRLIESIAPSVDYKFTIMITSLNRTTMNCVAEAVKDGSFVINKRMCQNLSTKIIATGNWPMSDESFGSGHQEDTSIVYTLFNKHKNKKSGWMFMLLQALPKENGEYMLNNCSMKSEKFVTFTILNRFQLPETYCGFDSNGTRLIYADNVTVHLKYRSNSLRYPTGLILGYLEFSAKSDGIQISNWAILVIVCMAIIIFVSVLSATMSETRLGSLIPERKRLMIEEEL